MSKVSEFRREIHPYTGLDFSDIENQLSEWAQHASTRGWKIASGSSSSVVLSRKSRKGMVLLPVLFIIIFVYYSAIYGFYAGLISLPIYVVCALCDWTLARSIIISAMIQQQNPPSVMVRIERPESLSRELVESLERMLSETGSSLI